MSLQRRVEEFVGYLSGIGGAVLSPRIDGFVDLSGALPKMVVSSSALAGLTVMGSVLALIFAFATAIGAARMSWCYNNYLGTSENMKIIYAVLAFFFCGLYYLTNRLIKQKLDRKMN